MTASKQGIHDLEE